MEKTNYTEYVFCPNGYEKSCKFAGTIYEECVCIMKSQPTITYTCGSLIMQDNKCYRYE